LTEPGDIAELSDDTFNWGAQPGLSVISAPKEIEHQALKIDTVDQYKHQLIKQAGPDSVIEHEVQQGETLYSIANRYSIDVSDLIKSNQLNVATPLKKGQLISIHKASPSVTADVGNSEVPNQPEMFTYEVKSSDTLYGIAVSLVQP